MFAENDRVLSSVTSRLFTLVGRHCGVVTLRWSCHSGRVTLWSCHLEVVGQDEIFVRQSEMHVTTLVLEGGKEKSS